MNYRVNLLYGFDGTSWTEVDISSGIKSLRYQGDCNTSQDMRFGVCLSESVEIEWFNDAIVPVKGNHLKVEIQNSLDNAWTNYGKFKVDRVEKHDITSTVYAYDSTYDLDVDFSARLKELNDNGAFPMSVTDLVLEALDTAGLVRTISVPSPEFAAPVIKAFYSNNITCKDIVLAFSAMTCTIAASSFNARATQYRAWLDGGDGISFVPYYGVDGSYIISSEGGTYVTPGGTVLKVCYKENGLKKSENNVLPITDLEIVNSSGEVLGSWNVGETTQAENKYIISGNILADNAVGTGANYTWNDIANAARLNVMAAIGFPLDVDGIIPCSLSLDMFPFEFPFKAGDNTGLMIDDTMLNSILLMHVTIDESSATISCGGNQSYETSQDQYKTLGEQNTTNMVNIEEIRKIRDVIGPYEPYLEAEDNHAVGDYFVWQSQLVKCTAAITAGDTIAVGTNVSVTDVVSELGGGSITVDNALSTTSTNPVQNLVITAALNAIPEMGGTASNGYIKFPSGLLICYGYITKIAVTGDFSSWAGGMRCDWNNIGHYFTVPFLSQPVINATISGRSNGNATVVRCTASNTSINRLQFFGNGYTTADGVNYTFDYVAFGRWR